MDNPLPDNRPRLLPPVRKGFASMTVVKILLVRWSRPFLAVSGDDNSFASEQVQTRGTHA